MTEQDKFTITEAKDHLVELTNSIRETRNRCWGIFVGSLVIFSFFFEKIIPFHCATSTIISMAILSIAHVAVQAYILMRAVFPTPFYFNGIPPDDLLKLQHKDVSIRYQNMIDFTDGKLKKMCDDYKVAVWVIVIWAVLSFFFVMFSEAIF